MFISLMPSYYFALLYLPPPHLHILNGHLLYASIIRAQDIILPPMGKSCGRFLYFQLPEYISFIIPAALIGFFYGSAP